MATDDIVTRLRELAIGGIYGINIAPFEHYNAAADEIERLRSLLERWLTVAECLYRACGSDPNAYVFDYPLIEAMEVYELAVKMGENK